MFRRRKSDHQKIKEKQLADLCKENPSATLVEKDVYEITVHSRLETFAILVVIPDDFPDKPPILKLKNSKGRKHAFLLPDGTFDGFSGLSPGLWSVHSHVGVIVRDIVKQLERNPPRAEVDPWGDASKPTPTPALVSAQSSGHKISSKNSPAVDPWDGTPTNSGALPPGYISNANPGSRGRSDGIPMGRKGSVEQRFGIVDQKQDDSLVQVSAAVIPSSFAEIESASLAELQELLEDEMLLRNFAESLSLVKATKSLRTDLENDVMATAKDNLSKKEKLEVTQREIKSLSDVLQIELLRAEDLSKQQRAKLSTFSLNNLTKMLTEAADSEDIKIDDVMQAYDKGEVDLNDFVKQYVRSRSAYHKLCIIKERLCP